MTGRVRVATSSVAAYERRTSVVNECLREGWAPLGHRGLFGKGSSIEEGARRLGISSATLWRDVQGGRVTPDWSLFQPASRETASRQLVRPPVPTVAPAPEPPKHTIESALPALRKRPMTLDEIADATGLTKGQALDALEAAKAEGLNIQEAGARWTIAASHPRFNPSTLDYNSRDDDTYVFGVTTDNHFASKQSRHDVIDTLYDEFAAEGVDRAFNGGNYLEGERDLNRFELTVHGLDAQVRHLIENFPRRDGITTYAVSGDDHEAWWSQKTGLDIGRKVEQDMRDAGRDDWVNAGFMEADFRLVNKHSGARSILRIVHPGGGSAYAISYKGQKYVEALEGGDKPAIVVFGHWHKMFAFNYRSVWCLGGGTTQDQSIFMRKGQMEAHVGGLIVTAKQDRATGAIVRCKVDQIRFFNRGYYEGDRHSYAGDVTHPARSVGGV